MRTRSGQLSSAAASVEGVRADLSHPRTLGWFGTSALAMGGSNQSLFLLGVILISQGSAAVPLLIAGLLLSWMATPGWIELIMMWPNRVGGIAATCAEAFRPYSPVLANLTGVCYWWGWVPTCGLTAFLSASAIHQWYLPGVPTAALACGLIVFFACVTMCGVKWAARLAMPIALASATLAVVSMIVPVLTGSVNWSEATSFHLVSPFEGAFGAVTSAMAGLYLIGFAAPAFEAAACHVGETVRPNQNVPRAMFASAAMASVYFIGLPIVWLGALGAGPLEGDLAGVLGPTFAPALGGAAAAAAVWFMVFNMFHGTLQPLAGAARTLLQLAEDGLLPRFLGRRFLRTDAPWVATSLTAGLAIGFVLIGTPIWLLAAANLTYLIGICLPSVAVWLLRRNEPGRERPFRAPRGTIVLGVVAASVWGVSTVLGFQQFGLPTVLVSMALAYAGSSLYAARLWSDRRRAGKPGFERSLHLKLTGAMLLVLTLDGAGYLLAVSQVPAGHEALVAVLEDIFVAVALLTITVGLVLPGLIGHAVGEVAGAAARLATGTLADLNRAIHALGAGDLEAARAQVDIELIAVRSKDEIGGMAKRFNAMQHEIARAAVSLDGAREGLREANDGLARLSRQNELLLTSAGEAIVGLDLDGKVTFMNPAASQIVGYSADELIGRNLHETVHHSRADGEPFPASECPTVAVLQGRSTSSPREDVIWHKDGHAVPVNCTATPIVENGEIAGAVIVASDMSAQRLLEAEVRQAQKMEAVGQLAGGVAHDFNNILTAISGYSEMALLRIDEDDQVLRQNIEEIRRASDRAAAMTHQLLAFSRKQLLQPKVLDLNDVVRETSGLLSRLIGDDIAVTTELEADLGRTKADAGQVGQVLLNLALNARDAMLDGGELTIATANVELDESFARANAGSTPGWYVVLSVRDTGVGMDESVQSRIFEPFYTTKDPGNGTGLGLSTAYGIVKQSNGYIEVRSAPGSGTVVNVYLPRTAAELAVDGQREGPRTAPRGAERILLVEDETIVRALVTESLESQGYSVLKAEGPAEALELCEREPAFDLLVTDVVMPGMNGRELAQRLIPGRPDLKVLFTSGYSSQVIGDGELEPGTAFLQKPFSLDELSQKVREVLETP